MAVTRTFWDWQHISTSCWATSCGCLVYLTRRSVKHKQTDPSSGSTLPCTIKTLDAYLIHVQSALVFYSLSDCWLNGNSLYPVLSLVDLTGSDSTLIQRFAQGNPAQFGLFRRFFRWFWLSGWPCPLCANCQLWASRQRRTETVNVELCFCLWRIDAEKEDAVRTCREFALRQPTKSLLTFQHISTWRECEGPSCLTLQVSQTRNATRCRRLGGWLAGFY